MEKERKAMGEFIYGNLEYCYDGVPVIRGYCLAEVLLAHSKAHDAYQRETEQEHVDEIKEFISSPSSMKFMPEVVLAYDYTGMMRHPEDWSDPAFSTPIDYLYYGPNVVYGTILVRDYQTGANFRRLTTGSRGVKTIQIDLSWNSLLGDGIVFRRIDGNHRLSAFEEGNTKDLIVPFCIVMLCNNSAPEIHEREKVEMEIFHNINSKAKPLTPIEQYRGLFRLFTVDELNKYGKEFSLAKAYLQKHENLRFENIKAYFTDIGYIVLFCIKFLLDRGFEISEDDMADIFSKLEHTYFADYEIIRSCQNRFAIVPYVYYCYIGGKQKNAQLDAYNAWFIKNRLYGIKKLDPASIIDTFNTIYEIRKKQIFVAMPFDKELDFVYKAICDTIDKINRENKTDLLKPVRMDKQILGYSYDIIEEMLDKIQNAGLLIADLTYQNANVYYEAGFVQGLIRARLGDTTQVLYLVSNPKEPDKALEEAKFDVNHYKIIPYKNVGNGVDELKASLEAELKEFYCI